MTESESTSTKELKEKNEPLQRLIHEDWFLQELVDLTNKVEEFELGVTLHMQGCIVSGTLISGQRYFREVAKIFATEGAGNHFSKWIESFAGIYEAIKESDEESIDESSEDSSKPPKAPPGYIHLKDAKVFGTGEGPVPSNEGNFWRGRICAVSGFNFGLLRTSSQDISE